MKRVGYLVVTWNSESIIAECIESLLLQEDVAPSIWILDNGSKDRTVEVIRRYPDVHLLRSDTNLGFAQGNNVLVKNVLADPEVDMFALVNADARLSPTWSKEILQFLDGKTHVSSAQGLVLDYYNHNIVDSMHILVSGLMQPIQYGYGERADSSTYFPRKVFGVHAAAAMYTRDFVEHQPDPASYFFDERFFMYYEDVDLAFRGIVSGFDAYFVPTAVAYHMGSFSSAKRGKDYSLMMMARNHPAVVYKNCPSEFAFRGLIGVLGLALDFSRRAKRQFGGRSTIRVLMSFLSGVWDLRTYRSSRTAVQQSMAIDPAYLLSVMNREGIMG